MCRQRWTNWCVCCVVCWASCRNWNKPHTLASILIIIPCVTHALFPVPTSTFECTTPTSCSDQATINISPHTLANIYIHVCNQTSSQKYKKVCRIDRDETALTDISLLATRVRWKKTRRPIRVNVIENVWMANWKISPRSCPSNRRSWRNSINYPFYVWLWVTYVSNRIFKVKITGEISTVDQSPRRLDVRWFLLIECERSSLHLLPFFVGLFSFFLWVQVRHFSFNLIWCVSNDNVCLLWTSIDWRRILSYVIISRVCREEKAARSLILPAVKINLRWRDGKSRWLSSIFSLQWHSKIVNTWPIIRRPATSPPLNFNNNTKRRHRRPVPRPRWDFAKRSIITIRRSAKANRF